MTYGLEVIPIKKKEMDQMETMQRKILKQLQGLSNQVANTAVYTLIGAVPIRMVIDRNMLSLLMNIIKNNNSLEFQIPERQVVMKSEKSNIFINRVEEALTKYGMEPVENLMKHPKSKEKWKRIVRYHQNKYWHEICLEDQSNKKKLSYLQIQENPSFINAA